MLFWPVNEMQWGVFTDAEASHLQPAEPLSQLSGKCHRNDWVFKYLQSTTISRKTIITSKTPISLGPVNQTLEQRIGYCIVNWQFSILKQCVLLFVRISFPLQMVPQWWTCYGVKDFRERKSQWITIHLPESLGWVICVRSAGGLRWGGTCSGAKIQTVGSH